MPRCARVGGSVAAARATGAADLHPVTLRGGRGLIGGLAPGRRSEVAQLGLRSILAGSLATFMTGCVAGILI